MTRDSDLAYWISPKGKYMEPTLYHIGAIVNEPEKFGETQQTINDTFDKHNEHVTGKAEGKARNEIMKRVIERGFIRLRKYNTRRMQHWSIELHKMTRKKAQYISDWAKWAIEKKITTDLYADVKVVDISNFNYDTGTLHDLAYDAFDECKVTQLDISSLMECSLIGLSKSGCAKNVVMETEEMNEWVQWSKYARSLNTEEISERAIIQMYASRLNGGW